MDIDAGVCFMRRHGVPVYGFISGHSRGGGGLDFKDEWFVKWFL